MHTLELAFRLYRRYEQVETIDNYYGLLALYGLCQAAKASGQAERMAECRALLAQYPEKAWPFPCNFVCYRLGGHAQAWAMLTGLAPRRNALLARYAGLTMAGSRCRDDLLYMPGMEVCSAIWIDTATAVTPFMLFAGLTLDRDDFVEFGARQCFGLYDALLDADCGLLHQCRGFLDNPGRRSADHWSRGNGWAYLALAELVKYLTRDHHLRAEAQRRYCDLSGAIARCQSPHGLWRQEMTDAACREESSGSACSSMGSAPGCAWAFCHPPSTGLCCAGVWRAWPGTACTRTVPRKVPALAVCAPAPVRTRAASTPTKPRCNQPATSTIRLAR